jgi:hypothetical protein
MFEQFAQWKDLVHSMQSMHNVEGMKLSEAEVTSYVLNCENEGDNREACLIFKAADADGDGMITVAEGKNFIYKLVEERFRAHVAENAKQRVFGCYVSQVINGHDVNNDGKLDYAEFLQSIQEAEGSIGGCG